MKEDALVRKNFYGCKVSRFDLFKKHFSYRNLEYNINVLRINTFSFDEFQVRVAFCLNLKISTTQLRLHTAKQMVNGTRTIRCESKKVISLYYFFLAPKLQI